MPPKTVINVIDPFLPIQKMELTNSLGLKSKAFAVVLDPEGDAQEVGVVSSNYNLVSNNEVVEAAFEILKRSGLEHGEMKHAFNGKQFRGRFVMKHPDYGFDAKSGPELDRVQLVLDVNNSYDGSSRFGLSFNLERLACSNGMMVSHLLGGFAFKHNSTNQSEFNAELDAAVQKMQLMSSNILLLAPKFQNLSKIKMDHKEIVNSLDELDVSDAVAGRIMRRIEDRNAWSVLNGYTNVYSENKGFTYDTANRKAVDYFLKMA